MNPADEAIQRWKPFRAASEHVDKAQDAVQAAQAKLGELRDELGPAEARDELALGRALLAAKAEPESEADSIREMIAAQESRVSALQRAYADVQEQLTAVIQENGNAWHRQAMGEIVRARTRYEAALTELDAARENLSSIVTLGEWVSSGGAHFAEAANDRLSGDGSLGFGQVLAALRADLEHLTHFDPPTPSSPTGSPGNASRGRSSRDSRPPSVVP
jgi:DNA repair exonuclease SbcCD ATPase subunit